MDEDGLRVRLDADNNQKQENYDWMDDPIDSEDDDDDDDIIGSDDDLEDSDMPELSMGNGSR